MKLHLVADDVVFVPQPGYWRYFVAGRAGTDPITWPLRQGVPCALRPGEPVRHRDRYGDDRPLTTNRLRAGDDGVSGDAADRPAWW